MEQVVDNVSSRNKKKWIIFVGLSVSSFLIGFAAQSVEANKFMLAVGAFLFVISLFLIFDGSDAKNQKNQDLETEKHQQTQQQLGDQLHKSNSVLHVFSNVAKLWDASIEVSRKKTEDSIKELGDKFSQIYTNIDAVVVKKKDGQEPNQQMFQAVQQSQEKLTDLKEIFSVMQDGRRHLVQMVQGLATHMQELSGMANEVSSIAAQTNLLALNAAIEAARAGESGRGFAVVADAVRTLSTRSSDTGKKMSESVEVINRSIGELIKLSDDSIQKDSLLIEDSDQKIKNILSTLKESSEGLVASSEGIKQQGVMIQREVSEVIVALQFQDRVSQILMHVRENMSELVNKAESYLQAPEAESALELDHWLHKMEARYATQEQRDIHSGNRPVQDDNQEITFF
jgi:methyl-accepting chemotaxis protein